MGLKMPGIPIPFLLSSNGRETDRKMGVASLRAALVYYRQYYFSV